ncbi:CNNM domain-containing protein [Candidatus Laterigemmans baculatus]|uniref:CNNM domain-containing protein n=1 Tax=Candidatus Laterigemmans baculatus TaxID=2770505 RepID=UPI001F4656A2|nr:hemolysin family protein [Candidatus Laterigemmans baculatus]
MIALIPLLLYFIFSIGFSFLCSIAEAVLLSVTPSFIVTLRESKPAAAERLAKLKENIDRPLAAILSLNTIAHTVGAAGVGAEAARLYGNQAVGIASAVMTLLILVLSEIIPKTIGALYWRWLSPLVGLLVDWLILLLYPLVWLSEQLTKILSGGQVSHAVTREELMAMAEIGAKEGLLDINESKVLGNLMRFRHVAVADIMTPRTVMIAFEQQSTVGEFYEKQSEVPVSRLPIFAGKLDDVTGFVLKSDLLLAQARGEEDRPLSDFRRDLPAVMETTPLPDLMEMLLDRRGHIAIVVDEYGSVSGLVTLEDLVETLLGLEIVDEHDRSVDMQQLARQRWEERARKHGFFREE